MNTKKEIFQKHRYQNPKPRSPMNSQHTHNALKNKKSSAEYFKDVKTEEAFSSRNYQFVMATFFEQKITTAQIHFCDDRQTSKIEE